MGRVGSETFVGWTETVWTVTNVGENKKRLVAEATVTKRFKSVSQYKSVSIYSTKPYLTLMRSSFSNIGCAANAKKIAVAAACIRSMGSPVT